jgi:hypothetical protein
LPEIDVSSSLRSAYVGVMHSLAGPAKSTGLIDWLDRRSESRGARWARSLFAIYDIDGMIALDLPWWTFDAIDEVAAFLAARPKARVFEYGSGASTVWLGRRAAEVFSTEHDASWYPIVSGKLTAMPHVRLRLVPPDAVRDPDPRYGSQKPGWRDRSFRAYVHAIDDVDGVFDLIIVDGRARPACLAHAAARLAPGGMIVFDNSRRGPYREAIAASGMRARNLEGLAACLPYPDSTTLLTR